AVPRDSQRQPRPRARAGSPRWTPLPLNPARQLRPRFAALRPPDPPPSSVEISAFTLRPGLLLRLWSWLLPGHLTGLLTIGTGRRRFGGRLGVSDSSEGDICLALGLTPRLPGLIRGRSRRWVAADHIELLTHRPQVRREQVDQDADRKVDATDRENQREDIEHDLLLLSERASQRFRR